MVQTSNIYEGKLYEAAEYLSAGQKKKARLLIRDVLAADQNNMEAWELLFRASYTSREQMICLREILRIQPGHPWARQQLAFIRAVNIDRDRLEAPTHSTSVSRVATSTIRGGLRGKRRQEPMLTWAMIMVAFLGVICIATWALAALRLGLLPVFASSGTATALAVSQASCQGLIERAMQASGQYCNQIGANRVCYGNNTVKAELVPSTGQSFSKRGDIVNVAELQRLSASPLNTKDAEWGVAIFQIQANLPRSLPGEMVKMVVFGNTNLRKNNGDLQTFYFSSELGQLVCEKLPYDGLMVSMPDGTGVKFTVNGAEMILMGNASFKATKNDTMQVSMYSGAGRIRSGGHERYFGAGQKVLVKLGGANGTEAIGEPSIPLPLSQAEYNVACALTRSYCSPSEIKTLSLEEITGRILAELGITSTFTETPTSILTAGPSATSIPSLTNIPSLTPISTLTFTPTVTRIPRATSTFTPRPTRTPTKTPPPVVSTATSGPSPTATLTSVFTLTNTPIPSLTPLPSLTPSPTLTRTPTNTPLPTATSQPTTTPPTLPVCGDVTSGGFTNTNSELDMTLTNNHGSPVTITNLHIEWVKKVSPQKLARVLLNGDTIWNTSDPTPPSDIPTESDWSPGAVLTIPDAAGWSLAAQFQEPLEAGNYSVNIVLDIGCQAKGTFSIP